MQKYNNYSKYCCDISKKVCFKGYLLKISPFLDKTGVSYYDKNIKIPLYILNSATL